MDHARITAALLKDLRRLRFGPPVTHIYNPLVYAARSYASYLRRYGAGLREVVLVGMNPGPWGMVQTGVPFGEVNIVRDWLKIRDLVGKPRREHPKRPVQGLACRRSEVSGARLWGWARSLFVTPQRFFKRFFIMNYCPLCFLEESGRNRTPDKLPAAERAALFTACDRAMRQTLAHLRPRLVIGIGHFAEDRVRAALDGDGPKIGRILHPSPASPAANRDWAGQAGAALATLGIRLPRGETTRC